MSDFTSMQRSYDLREPEDELYEDWIEVSANFNYDLLLKRCGSDKRILELLKKAYSGANDINEDGIYDYLLGDFEVSEEIENVVLDGECFVHPDYSDEFDKYIDAYHEGTWKEIVGESGLFIDQFKINKRGVPVSTVGGVRIYLSEVRSRALWLSIKGRHAGVFYKDENFCEIAMWDGSYEIFENIEAMATFVADSGDKTFCGFLREH